jgi:hypothetical protein
MTGIGIPPVPRPYPPPPDHEDMERLDPGMTNLAVAMIKHYDSGNEELVKIVRRAASDWRTGVIDGTTAMVAICVALDKLK